MSKEIKITKRARARDMAEYMQQCEDEGREFRVDEWEESYGYGRECYPDTYRRTEWWIGMQDKGLGVSFRDLDAYRPHESRIIDGGAWIMVTKSIPVADEVKPIVWGVYWATPCNESQNYDGFDRGGRYKVEITVRNEVLSTTETVGLFPFEYIKINLENIQADIDKGGWTLQTKGQNAHEGMDLELIERGRSLTEEERSIIWSLQLDGLSELHSCQEYFMSRHIETENHSIWYKPHPDVSEQLSDLFGRVGDPIGA